jgi:hypothetical protein
VAVGWLPLAAAEAPPWLAEVAGLVPIVGFLLADDLRLEPLRSPA